MPFTIKQFTVFFIILVYVSGISGMYSLWRDWFVALTPVSLLLSVGFLLWHHPVWTAGTYRWCVLAFLAGFGAEVLGVNTGFPFGDYTYGAVLGPGLWNTPFMIGVNWLMVTYCCSEAWYRLAEGWRLPLVLHAAGIATLCTALDWLIEPVAIRLGYWSWAGAVPPLQNYVGWWVVSWLIACAYGVWMGPSLRNNFALLLLGLQVLFFLCL
jgi:uncharacterized membrane protein